MSPTGRSFSWPPSIDAVWLLMPLFVVCVRTLIQPIPPEDYWWHLVMGRLIEHTGSIPDSNLFLYTMAVDHPFHDQPWLAQWVMFRTVDGFGHIGAVALHAALLLGTWSALVFATARRGANPIILGIAAAAAHYMSAGTLTPRTQMFAYPCFIALLLVVVAYARAPSKRRARAMWIVTAVATVIWANVHGTFVFAPVIVGVVAAGGLIERWRRQEHVDRTQLAVWAVTLAIAGGSMFATPHGVENISYIIEIFGATKGAGPTVVEWAPPGLDPSGIAFYLALIAGAALVVRRRGEVTVWEIGLLVVFAIPAVTSVRAIIWWALPAVVVLVPHASASWPPPRRDPSTREGIVNTALLGALVVVAVGCWPGMPLFRAIDPAALFGEGRLGEYGDAAVLSTANPVALVPVIPRAAEARIFHYQGAAGFLEWSLTTASSPAPVAFVDQRLELVEPRLWDEYFDVSRVRSGWRDVVKRYEIDTYLIRADEQELLWRELLADPRTSLLREHEGWGLFVTRER